MTFVTHTLGEISDEVGGIIRTGPFGSQLHESDYSDEGLPVVMPKNIIDNRVSIEGIARIGDEDAERLSGHKLKKGDIVYGRRGDIGRHALVTEKENGWLCGTGCLRISLGESVLEPLYLHYYLSQENVSSWIHNQAIGATMPNLNTSIVRSVAITYPALPTQRKIAAILSAYDNLIENNTRRIAILEEMAQAIYREWFVHFRFPGHAGVRMVESELGPVPEGWEIKRFSDTVDINPAIEVDKEAEKPFVEMAGLSTTSMVIECTEKRTGRSGAKFQNSDTLFPRITPSVENGKRGFVQFLGEGEAGLGSTEFIVFRSRSLCPEYVYLLSCQSDFRDNAVKSMVGASGRQRVQNQCFDNYWLAQPPQTLLDQFSKLVSPMFRNIQSLTDKNTNLRQTRDLLLPRLVSGQLDVSGLEIDIGELGT